MNKKIFQTISKYRAVIVTVIGIFVLFFFPEPETNFLAYVATIAFFVILIIFLLKRHRGEEKTSTEKTERSHKP